jgi:hypothetical protein
MRERSLPAASGDHANTVAAFQRNFLIALTAFAQQSLYLSAFVGHSLVSS